MSSEDKEQLVDRMLLTLKYAEEPEWKILAEYIENLQQENKQLKDRINKAVEILHNINEDLPLDLILTEIEHTEYVLKGDKE